MIAAASRVVRTATIAVIAVSAKELARRLSGASEGGGALIMRGLEFGAAGLVLLFGVGLLFGYIAAERVTCLQSGRTVYLLDFIGELWGYSIF
jgi:nickel/cobalt exporter